MEASRACSAGTPLRTTDLASLGPRFARRRRNTYVRLAVPTVVGENVLGVFLAVPRVVGENILGVFLAVPRVVGENILGVFSCPHGGRGKYFGRFFSCPPCGRRKYFGVFFFDFWELQGTDAAPRARMQRRGHTGRAHYKPARRTYVQP